MGLNFTLSGEAALESLGVIFLLISWTFYKYLTKYYDYWAKKGVRFKKPEFPFGSLKDNVLARTCIAHGHDKVYKEFPEERFYGIIDFRRPALVVRDPDLARQVLVKDFEHFTDRAWLMGNPKEYINLNLLNLSGEEWKKMRSKLTPTFSSGKLKLMYGLMKRASKELKDQLEKELQETNTLDVKDVLARFTLDIIVSCAFGIDAHCLSDKDSIFVKTFRAAKKTTKTQRLKRIVLLLFPNMAKALRINLVGSEMSDLVTRVVRDNILYRIEHDVTRNDFLDLLMNIKSSNVKVNGNEDGNLRPDTSEGLTLQQMVAQTYLFFLGGFDSSSSLLTFCLYELSSHQNVQDKLYQELNEVINNKYNGDMSYEVLKSIDYLDQVIKETLRMYGTANALSRKCTKRYQVPGSDLVIEKGIKVTVPLFSIHHDPRHYPEPYSFKPERFSPEQCGQRHPLVFLPFGEGPRSCIAKRFGMMQTRLGLATVLLKYRLCLSADQEVPIEIDKKSVPIMPANPVLLRFFHRTR